MERMQRLAQHGVHQLDDQTLQTREKPFVLEGEE